MSLLSQLFHKRQKTIHIEGYDLLFDKKEGKWRVYSNQSILFQGSEQNCRNYINAISK